MRLASMAKMGYYPAHPDAVDMAAACLRAPAGPWSMLDLCAGEGAAIKQLAEHLKIAPEGVHAIELDEARGEMVKANLPNGKVLAPASAFGCSATFGSFSLIWCNPPFDTAMGGGRRTEYDFLEQATHWLKPGGVLALVCPEDTANEYSKVFQHLKQWYTHVSIRHFPDHCREYEEVLVLAVRRKEPIAGGDAHLVKAKNLLAPDGYIYDIPAGPGPKTFKKIEPTDLEWQRLLVKSPLRQHLDSKASVPLPSPPLALSTGHVALLLASGQLDGLVCPPDETPHVVRGTATKVEKIVSEEVTEDAKGNETTKIIKREHIQLVVRVVEACGTISTFAQE